MAKKDNKTKTTGNKFIDDYIKTVTDVASKVAKESTKKTGNLVNNTKRNISNSVLTVADAVNTVAGKSTNNTSSETKAKTSTKLELLRSAARRENERRGISTTTESGITSPTFRPEYPKYGYNYSDLKRLEESRKKQAEKEVTTPQFKPTQRSESPALPKWYTRASSLGMDTKLRETKPYDKLAASKAVAEINKHLEAVDELEKEKENATASQRFWDNAGYIGEKFLLGAVDALEDTGDFILGAPHALGYTIAKGFRNEAWADWHENEYNWWHENDLVDAIQQPEDKYIYASKGVKDWGWLPETIGNLVPWIVEAYATAGASSGDDIARLGTTAYDKVVKFLTNPSTLFGTSAAGSASEEAVKKGANPAQSAIYGTATGLMEVGTEKIFPGIADSVVGDTFVKFTSKVPAIKKVLNIPGVKKVLSIGGEAIEEQIMTGVDPTLQRITGIDVNAPHATWSEYKESGTHGAILSFVMGIANMPVQHYNRRKVINDINTASQAVNNLMVDDAPKLKPLPIMASDEAIEQRQKEIATLAQAYDTFVEQNVAMEEQIEDTTTFEEEMSEDIAIDYEDTTAVEWTAPDNKTPIAYSSESTMEWIQYMAEGETSTISELQEQLGYDEETYNVLQSYIDAGYGNRIATEVLSADRTRTEVKAPEITPVAEKTTYAETDSLEKAARDVVEARMAEETPAVESKETPTTKSKISLVEKLEAQSLNNEELAVEDVKKATGFGNEGAKLIADVSSIEGATFSLIATEAKPAYLTGFNNPDLDIKKVAHTFTSKIQEEAYTAGQKDSIMQNPGTAKNFRVAGDASGVLVNVQAAQHNPDELEMANTVGEDFGVKMNFEERIIANYETEAEVNAVYEDGEITLSNNSDNKLVEDVSHESFHRMIEVNTPEAQVLMRELYAFADENGILFDNEKASHDSAGITLNTRGYIEEVAADTYSKLWKSESDWLKWRERLASNTELRSSWEKLMDIVSELFEKIKRLLKEGSISKEARAKVNKDLAELERMRNLAGEAYKATMDAVAEKTNEAKAEAKATAKTETKTETKATTEATGKPTAKESKPASKETTPEAKLKPKAEKRRPKVGEVYKANATGKTYTITERNDTHTTYTVTDNKGKTTTRTVTNSAADTNFNRKGEKGFTKVEGNKSIKAGDVFATDKATYQIVSRGERNTIVQIISEDGKQNMVVSNEIADRNFSNMPKDGITKWIDEADHIDNRDWDDVGNRKVKAFQYLFPEMQDYYKPLAKELISDLNDTVQGQRMQTGSYEAGDQEWTGVKRVTSESIAAIKDKSNATYDDIRNALNRLIEDKGQENIALAKRIELVFDDMLTNGYTTFDGMEIPPNEEYITKKEALIGKEYEKYEPSEWTDEELDDLIAWESTRYSLKGNEKTDTKSTKNLEIKINEEYNGSDLRTKIKYSPRGIKLPKKEFRKFYQSTSTDYYKSYKTHEGLQYQSCVTDDSHILYIYEDGGFGNYNVVAKIDYKYDEVANAVTEVLNGGETYKITEVVNDILETFEVRRSGYTVYNASTKKRSGSRGDGALLERTSKTNARGTNGSGGRVSGDKRGTESNGRTGGSVNEGKRYSLKDNEGKTLTNEQAEYFKDSKVRDSKGNLLVVYHGSPSKFTVFNHDKINAHGNAHGRGFYFTSNKSFAEGYKQNDGQLLKGYLNITNPLSEEKVTIKKAGLLKLIKATCKEQAEEYVRDEGYDSVSDALRDTWISNYVDTYRTSIDNAYREVANIIYSGNTNDVEMIAELTNAGAGTENVLRLTNDILGYDGVIFENEEGHNEFVSLVSEQFKSVDNVKPTSNPDINFSLKGGVSTSELFDLLQDAKKGKKKAFDKLEKYAESGVISTEAYNDLVDKYGAIKTGEKPHREVSVPTKTAKDKKVSETVRTVLEAEATPDTLVPTIEKMVEDGVFSYEVYTDKEAVSNAEEYIKTHGWEESLLDWFDAVNKGEVSKDLTTTGWALYNNAANKAATATTDVERKEATEISVRILDAMIKHQRSAAQALQATRILKKLSPDAQLYAVKRSIESLQNELKEKYGKKAPDLEIDVDLAEKFLNAETEEARLEAEIEIYKDIGRQMPSTFMDKWNAWRYLAMLGNLRTHIRNVVGNAGFAPIVATKNLVATGIESIVAPVVRLSGKEMLRGKKFVFGSKTDRALLKAAWDDYANVADMVSNGGKYNDSAMANKHIEEGRKKFKSKLFAPVEWLSRKNSQALETEDVWFSKPHYAYALAMYCKANNITPEQIKNGKAIAPARDYAINEARKATYKDTNAVSQFVSELGRVSTKKNFVTKASSVVIEGVLPFRKTPANILVRGVEYSPLGLVKGLTRDLYKVSKGKMNAYEAIDNISAGLTGTGLIGLGIYLAAQGLVRGHGEDEEKEKEFNELIGRQSYSLELPNGQSITLDWLAPEALPFFVGVNIWESTKGSDEKVNMASILNSITNITEPMLEMSCLQGLNDLVEGVGYASSNGTSGLTAVLSSAITSYLMQGLPTLLGQAERTGELYRQATYTEKDGFLTGDLQYTLGKASGKIPFWEYNQIPYIDAWGRKEASGSALKRGLNNFLNPAYTSKIEMSDMEKELLRVYEQTGEASVFPTRADKYFKIDGVRKDLTAEEYVRYATLKGEKSYQMVTELVESEEYKKLSDKEKAKAIQEVYDYANQKAKEAIAKYKPQSWVNKADDFEEPDNYLLFRTKVSEVRKANGDKISKEEVVDIILDMAENDDEIWKMYLSEYDNKGAHKAKDEGVEGKTYVQFASGVSKAKADGSLGKGEVVDVITDLNVNDDDAWALYFSEYDDKGAHEAQDDGVGGRTYMKFASGVAEADEDGSLKKGEVVEVISDLNVDDDDAWALYFSKYDDKGAHEAKANGVDGNSYMEYLAAISKAEEDGSLKKGEVVEVISEMDIDDDEAWSLYLGKYDSEVATEAEKHGISAKLYMTATVELGDIKADYMYNGERVDGKYLTTEERKNAKVIKDSRRAKVETYLNSVCGSYKEYLFLLGTEYSSVKDDADYIQYFGN